MHGTDLSERVIAVKREFIARADVALKRRRPGKRAAECPARIRKRLSVRAFQRIEVDRRPVRPQQCGLLDELAVIPRGSGLDGKSARDASDAGGLNTAHPVATTVGFCHRPRLYQDPRIPLPRPML